MPELPIAASVSLSSLTQANPDLLRTPTAVEGDGGAYSAEEKLAKGRMVMLRDQIVDLIDAPNLPTPTTQSAQRNSRASMVESAKRAGIQLEQAIELAQGILPKEFKSWEEVPESLIPILPTMPTITTNGTGRHSAGYDSLGTLQMLEVSRGELPREYASWDEINHKIPEEWRNGRAALLLPTPAVAHVRNHDEPLEDYLARRADYEEGRASGMPGRSLGVAIRLEQEGIDLFPTPNTMDSLPVRDGEALERQLRRGVDGGPIRKSTGNLREDIVLLTTPVVDDSKNSGQNTKRFSSLAQETFLLGTPRTSSANGSTKSQREAGATKGRLEDQVELLPTILATEGTKMDTTQSIEDREAGGHQVALTNIARSGVEDSSVWGRYAPAIRRWERVTGRTAPAPTKPDGKEGAHRLSSAFTEWMMGLPEGWITGVGLTRNEELKLAGNGVVPQQAELALRILIPTQLQQGAK